MMLAFIMYMTLRNATHQKDMVEVGARWGWGEGGAGLLAFTGEDLQRGRAVGAARCGGLRGGLDVRARPQGWG